MPSKNYDIRRIRRRSTYTISEISCLLGVHIRTVQSWHKDGMTPIEPSDKPLLFLGSELKRYLLRKKQARKCKLEDDQFFCPRCKAARRSLPQTVRIEITMKRIGRSDRLALIRGSCESCGCAVTRFSTVRKVRSSFWNRVLEVQEGRLQGNLFSGSNTDMQGGEKSASEQQE